MDRKDRRSMILLSAIRLFAQKGYYKTTMEDIAIGAEIGKSTVYEYFASKQDLFCSIIREGYQCYLDFLEQKQRELHSIEERLENLLFIWLFFIDTHYDLYRILQNCFYDESLSQLAESLKEELDLGLTSPIRKILQEGMAQGKLQVLDMTIIENMLIGTLAGLVRIIHLRHQSDTSNTAQNLNLLGCDLGQMIKSRLSKENTAELRRIAAIVAQTILKGISK